VLPAHTTSAAGSRGGLGLPRSAGSAAAAISPPVGAKKRCAIAVGMIADSTTTVTNNENWVRSMIPA
jgi:hypothetical protein